VKKIAAVIVLLILGILTPIGGFLLYYSGATDDPAFFESDIQRFEEADRTAPPAPGAIVFVGSSSIRLWRSLEEDMAPLRVVNRGFGGSQLSHVIHNASRIIVPYAPRAVVIYAGDNDLASSTGKDADRVVADYRALVSQLRGALPDVEIYYLSIKPSKLRWDRWPEMSRANEAIAALCDSDARLHFVDVSTPLLGSDGRPRNDVFIFDGLHLNAKGYAAWAAVVAPLLRSRFPTPGLGS
jgi:lysophospholipase L1-like esterase